MTLSRERTLLALLALNLVLQAFDGLATYAGLRAGVAEANPLVRWGVEVLGPAPALALFKLEACACLAALYCARRSWLVAPALVLCATLYAALSLAPWTTTLARLHFTYALL